MGCRRQLLVCICLILEKSHVHGSRIKDALESGLEYGSLEADPEEFTLTPIEDGISKGNASYLINNFEELDPGELKLSPTPPDMASPPTPPRPMPPKPQRFKVLSYNICWGCMEADTGDSTGMKNDLAKECVKLTDKPGARRSDKDNEDGINVTRCAANIADAVVRFHQQIGKYDLMGFQEASNFHDLYLKDRLSGSMEFVEYGAEMQGYKVTKGIHKGKKKKAWIVSGYNKDTLGDPDMHIEGYQKTPMQQGSARPYLILIFDSAKLMFINLHNAQPKEGKSWYEFPKEMNDKMWEAFKANPSRKKYRVIMTGDFNDLGAELPGCIVLPWSGATMRIRKPYAETCCKTEVQKGRKSGSMKKLYPGDYIMDSWSTGRIRLPDSYDPSLPQSDHRPVEGTFKQDNTWTENWKQDGKCIFKKFQNSRTMSKAPSRKPPGPGASRGKAKGGSGGSKNGRNSNQKGKRPTLGTRKR